MLRVSFFKILSLVSLSLPVTLAGQIEDCVGAQVICDDGVINFNPSGSGLNDFNNPNNDPGCLLTYENQSAWYYFEFNTDMPPNSLIEFTINPNGGLGEDYDFAIYGPYVACDSLGEPVRCSFANFLCSLCPLTGLGMGATDNSEGAIDQDGFVAPMVVQPGEGYYMILDNWYGSSTGFELTWGGSAAPYLNCLANPECNAILADAGPDLVVCAGAGPVQLQGSVSNAVGSSTFQWSGAPEILSFLSDPNISNPTLNIPADFSGTIALTLHVVNGACDKIDFLNIEVHPSPEPVISGPSMLCPEASATLEANDGFETYLWSNSGLGQSIAIDAAGLYFVTVTDANGCAAVDSLLVETFQVAEPVITGGDQFCTGSSLTLQATPGFSTYLWSDGSAEDTLFVAAPGDIGVTVTDADGCATQATLTVVEHPLPAPVISGNLAFCPDASTILQVEPVYNSYQWSDGSDAPSAEVSNPGLVSVTVTDANGCSNVATATVAELSPPVVAIQGGTKFCQGESLLLNAGTGFSSYQWSNGSSIYQTTVLTGGDISVTVTDANGCEAVSSIFITVNPLPDLSLLPPQTSFCAGESTVLDAGPGFESYLWSDNSTGQTLEVNQPGIYTVNVIDENNCQADAQVEAVENPLPNPSISGVQIICPGETTLLQSQEVYSSYLWSTGEPTPSIEVDFPGDYTLTVFDSFGCEGSTTVNIGQYPAVTAAINGDPLFCPGESALLDAGAGFASYLWSDGTTGQTIDAVLPGSYAVVVTDANGCSASASIEVDLHEVILPDLPPTAAFCEGESLVLDAGAGFQAYLWSDGSQDRTLTVTQGGSYDVIVADGNGCLSQGTVAVVQNPEPDVEIDGPSGFCPGESATLTATAGFVTYSWPDASQESSITTDIEDTYTVIVTDGNGCSAQASASLLEFIPPAPSIFGNASFCEGESTVLTLDADYSAYEWSAGPASPALSVNIPGLYAVTVTDENGCEGQAELLVQELPLPEVSIAGDAFFCEGGSAALQATPGLGSYLWSNGSLTAGIVVNAQDIYSVTVTDQAGCSSASSVAVEEIELPAVNAGPDFLSIDCNDPSATLGGDPNGGDPDWQFIWSGPGIDDDNRHLPNPVVDVQGLYTLIVTDTIHGCQSEGIQIEVEDLRYEPQAVLAVSGPINCNESQALLDGTGSEAGAHILYEWLDQNGNALPGANEITLPVTLPGSYFLQVVDALTGCSAQTAATVEADLDAPQIEAATQGELNCEVESLTIYGEIDAAGAPMEFSWTTIGGNIIADANTLHPMVDQPGLYILSAQNIQNGCESSVSVEVMQDIQPPVADAGPDGQLDCSRDEADLDGSASSAGPTITYEWTAEDGSALGTGREAIVAAPGIYTLIVTNHANGCKASDQAVVTLLDNAPAGIEFEVDHPPCFGQENGQIRILGVTGGTSPFVFSIDGQTFFGAERFSNLAAGVYDLQVQDALGCEYSLPVYVEQGVDVQLELGDDLHIRLGETARLEALTNLAPGQIASFEWNASDDSESCDGCFRWEVRPFQTTAYVATIVDENGCTAKDYMTVFVQNPKEVFIPNAISPNGDGVNDILMVFAGGDVALVKSMKVMTRWGEHVFEQRDFPPNDPQFGWNGQFRGREFNSTVLVYVAEVEFIDGFSKVFMGDVTIVR
jgi:hypothetical protein